MIIVFAAIGLILAIIGKHVSKKEYEQKLDTEETVGCVYFGCGVCLMVVCVFATLIMLINISKTYSYTVNIGVLENHNKDLEISMNNTIRLYMKSQNPKFNGLVHPNNDAYKEYLVKYPELNYNQIIKYSLENYYLNQQKILELKFKMNKIYTYRWWLTFYRYQEPSQEE